MENIVSAIPAGQPAAGTAPAATTAADGTDKTGGLFAALLGNALVQGGAKGKKGASTQTDSTDITAMIAALLQYGALFNQLPTQAGTTPAAPQAAAANTATQAAGVQGMPGIMNLMAARLMMNLGQNAGTDALTMAAGTPDEQQATTGATPQQAAQEFLTMLNAMESSAQAPAAQAAQVLNPTQGNRVALAEIKELFASLIDAGQQEQPQAAASQSAAPVADTVIGEPQASGAQALQTLLESITSEPDNNTQQAAPQTQGGEKSAQTFTSKSGELPDTTAKAQGPSSKDDKGFDGTLRLVNHQAPHATITSAPETAKASTPNRVSASQAFDSIVDKITSAVNGQQKELEINLKPDSLGKVVIKLTMDGDGLVARITASNPKTQDAFASQAVSLQNALADTGLKDVRVVVTSTAVADAALQQQSTNQGQSRQEREKKHNPVVVDSISGQTQAPTPLLAYEPAARTGLVNRLA